MINNRSVAITAAALDGIIESDEWEFVKLHDPAIKAAFEAYSAALEAAKPHLPFEQYFALDSAVMSLVCRHSEAGMMFGMNAVFSMREAVEHQAAVSGYWMRKAEERRNG